MSLQSDAINELAGALAKAQGEMSHAAKESLNPHFRSKYADLSNVWEACRSPLSKNGLAVTQTMDFAGEKPILITMLAHSSGQWIKSIMLIPVQKAGAQELGACITYCRRYALASLVGVYQDDDDGEAAQKPVRAAEEAAPNKNGSLITEKQCGLLDVRISEYPPGKDWILKKFNLKSVYDLKKDQFQEVLDQFEKKSKELSKETPNG